MKKFDKETVSRALNEKKVGVVMREYKKGALHSGGSGNLVTNPKQAIAIALSVARRKG